MSFLDAEEKKQLASSMISAKTKWYKKRKAVIDKIKNVKKDDILREILYVLVKIYFELKKPK